LALTPHLNFDKPPESNLFSVLERPFMPTVTPSNKRSKRFAVIGLLMGAVMISFSGVWVKVSQVSPITSAFYRVLIGAVILLPAALYRTEIKWQGQRSLLLCLSCGLLFSLDLSLYHYSINYVGPGLATILPNLEVLILAAFGFFFLHEKISLSYIFSIPLALGGLFLIIGVEWRHLGQLYKIGVYCGLVAAFCYAGFLLAIRTVQSDQGGDSFFSVLMLVSFSTAAFLGLGIYLTDGSFKIPDLKSLMTLAALGLFSQALGWILITNALPLLRASLSGLILLLQPALAFVWDVLFFKRPTGIINWMGVILVLAAMYLGTTKAPDFE